MKPIYRYLLFFLLLLPAIALRDYTPDNELRYISLVNDPCKTAPGLPSTTTARYMPTNHPYTSGTSP